MKGPAPSLLIRMLWRLGGLVILSFAVAAGFVIYELQLKSDTLRDRSLRTQAEDIARHLQIADDGEASLELPDNLARFYLQSTIQFIYFGSVDHYVYVVADDKGTVLFASNGQEHPLAEINPVAMEKFAYFSSLRKADRRRQFGTSLRVERQARSLWVQVAQGPQHSSFVVDSMLVELILESGWWVITFLIALLLIVFLTLRNSLKPLLRASNRAENIGPDSTDIRLPEQDMPREVLPLIGAVNSAFERLEQGFKMQREFTADAAHQLRTPLTILQTRLSIMEKNEHTEALRNDVRRMSRMVAQLLKIAQFDAMTISKNDTADLRAICVDVASMLAPLAMKQKKTIEVRGYQRPVLVRGNTDALTHAIRNLVENAIEHAPPRTAVTIDIDKNAIIRVVDKGPGIAPEHRNLAFQRFWRADQRLGTGSGLGLAIVARTLEAHGGTVEISDTLGGGATFSINLNTSANTYPH